MTENHQPDSTPTPVSPLGWRQLRGRCEDLAEQLEARAARHSRLRFDVQQSVRCRWLADRLRDHARAFERLPDVHEDVLEHRRNLLTTDYQDLLDEAQRMLR